MTTEDDVTKERRANARARWIANISGIVTVLTFFMTVIHEYKLTIPSFNLTPIFEGVSHAVKSASVDTVLVFTGVIVAPVLWFLSYSYLKLSPTIVAIFDQIFGSRMAKISRVNPIGAILGYLFGAFVIIATAVMSATGYPFAEAILTWLSTILRGLGLGDFIPFDETLGLDLVVLIVVLLLGWGIVRLRRRLNQENRS